MDRTSIITVTQLREILQQIEAGGHGSIPISMSKSIFIRDLTTTTHSHAQLEVPCFRLAIEEGRLAPRRGGGSD